MKKYIFIIMLGLSFLLSCSSAQDLTDNLSHNIPQNFKILSLGDSYTIGQNVCETCRFPEQLKDSLLNRINNSTFTLDIIAQTGWTTTNLIQAIDDQNPMNDYDLVTLLIGVNNQFQSKPFNLYEEEFPSLIMKAIEFAKYNKSNVMVISIPDYAFTPFGQNYGNPQTTSAQIDTYNAFAQNYCYENDITFVNITDITRQGLNNPELVATDGLHPSSLAYTKFVERLRPIAIEKLQ
jgi:lysophospholipase L1-like esterase